MRVAGKALAAGAALALMISACGSGGSSQGDEGGRQAVMAVQSLPDNLTLFPYGGNASQTVLSGLGSQLAGYEQQSCDSAVPGQVVGKLAESIELDAARTALTVKLKPLKSQSGNTLSSEDVRWSFVDYGFVIQPVLKKTFESSGFDVDNLVTIVDKSTLKLNLKAWNSYSDEMLQNPLAYVYDSTEAKKHAGNGDPVAQKWLFTHLADYSGWKLEEFTPGQSLSVTADKNWGGAQRKIDRLVIRSVPDNATRQQLLTSGQAQVATGFQFDQYKSIAGSDGVKVTACKGLNMDNLMFSTKKPPLDDKRVRQAISMAIDRDKLVAGAYFGYATPAKSSLNEDFGGGVHGDTYTYDVAKAKALLSDAGYPNGFELALTYSPTRPGPVVERTAILVQSMLKDVGIKVQLKKVTSPTEMSEIMYINHNYQATLYGEPVAVADPAYLSWIKFGNSPNNSGTFWTSPAMDKLLSQLGQIPDDKTAERQAVLAQIAQIGDTEAPLIELVETPYLLASRGITTGNPLPNGQIAFNSIGGK
jgi:peptide/nickel transport system substrate-binding protein